MQDFFVGVLIVIVAAAGIWCWWFENKGEHKEKHEDSVDKEKRDVV